MAALVGLSFGSRGSPHAPLDLQAESEGVCSKSGPGGSGIRGSQRCGGRWAVGTLFLLCKMTILLTLLNCTLKNGEDSKLFFFKF